MIMRIPVVALAVILAGCTSSPREAERTAMAQAAQEQALQAELAGLVPGQPTACLPAPTRTQLASEGYGATILYTAGRNLKYRNDTTGGCERIARGDILVTRSPSDRSCRGDIATTVDRQTGFQTGSCALGDFVTYRRPQVDGRP
jgi:hypothetical protein